MCLYSLPGGLKVDSVSFSGVCVELEWGLLALNYKFTNAFASFFLTFEEFPAKIQLFYVVPNRSSQYYLVHPVTVSL